MVCVWGGGFWAIRISTGSDCERSMQGLFLALALSFPKSSDQVKPLTPSSIGNTTNDGQKRSMVVSLRLAMVLGNSHYFLGSGAAGAA